MGRKNRSRYTLKVNEKGKVVKMYPHQRLQVCKSAYMIAHTKEHLTYERLTEHITQCGQKEEDFWETISLNDELLEAQLLESLQLVEVENY